MVAKKGYGLRVEDILARFKTLANPQRAVIYKRHGSGDNVYGVLTSEIAKLGKKIQVDHGLSKDLWETGNAEARILALLIADPAEISRQDADALVRGGPVRFLGTYLSDLLACGSFAEATMRAWMQSKEECHREIGYGIFGVRLRRHPESISDAYAKRMLGTIGKEIHRSPNWVRYAMNGALISIGVFKPALRRQAKEVAKRVGKVEVDHGETTCKTPDALSSIEKASKRKSARN